MILITGGLGFIGSHVALQLLSRGEQVVLVDNLANANLQTLARMEYIAQMYLPFVKVDVRNTPALNKVFEEFSIDAVVHCAAFKSIEESNVKPLEYYNDNVSCIMSLLRAMQRTGVRQLVNISSLAVYGTSSSSLTENTPFVYDYPNPYIKSQQMIENIIADTFKTDNEWKIATLRVSNVAGAFENGILGEMMPQLPKNIIPITLQAIAGLRGHLELQDQVATEDGSTERSFVHVLDVGEAIIAALQWLPQQNHCYEAFNIANTELISIKSLLKQAQHILKKNIEIHSANDVNHELAQIGADIRHAQTLLAWQPKRNLEQILQDQWRFYQNILGRR